VTKTKYLVYLLLTITVYAILGSCQSEKPPVAPAVNLRDSVPLMVTHGVSKLISDSGVIRYRIVAEEWNVYDKTTPSRQTFPQGLLLEKFDERFHVEMYITADTAVWYDQNLWELRGRVCVWNADGTIFRSELLYWNMERHEFYSNKYSRLVSPLRNAEGVSFRSNEQMTQYEVNVAKATFPLPNETNEDKSDDTGNTIEEPLPSRPPMEARPKTEKPKNLPPGGHFK
jgi:LPS export ABC transporter protein LptC